MLYLQELQRVRSCAAADLSPLKASEGAGSQNDMHNDRLETSSCHVNSDSIKTEISDDLPVTQCSDHDHKYSLFGSVTSANNNIAKVMNESLFKSLPPDTPHLDLLASSQIEGADSLTLKFKAISSLVERGSATTFCKETTLKVLTSALIRATGHRILDLRGNAAMPGQFSFYLKLLT